MTPAALDALGRVVTRTARPRRTVGWWLPLSLVTVAACLAAVGSLWGLVVVAGAFWALSRTVPPMTDHCRDDAARLMENL